MFNLKHLFDKDSYLPIGNKQFFKKEELLSLMGDVFLIGSGFVLGTLVFSLIKNGSGYEFTGHCIALAGLLIACSIGVYTVAIHLAHRPISPREIVWIDSVFRLLKLPAPHENMTKQDLKKYVTATNHRTNPLLGGNAAV